MKFSFAKVTNSRLMGTMGLLISWEDKQDKIVQYFLLDAEGLGLADYVSLKNPTKELTILSLNNKNNSKLFYIILQLMHIL